MLIMRLNFILFLSVFLFISCVTPHRQNLIGSWGSLRKTSFDSPRTIMILSKKSRIAIKDIRSNIVKYGTYKVEFNSSPYRLTFIVSKPDERKKEKVSLFFEFIDSRTIKFFNPKNKSQYVIYHMIKR